MQCALFVVISNPTYNKLILLQSIALMHPISIHKLILFQFTNKLNAWGFYMNYTHAQ
jgi:hypothetical protein